MSFASGAILFVIGADDKYLKSIKPITVIDARIDYINSRNRPLYILLARNFSCIYQTQVNALFGAAYRGLHFHGARHVVAGVF